MFSNILIYFVIIPLLMLAGFALCRNDKQIRAVAVIVDDSDCHVGLVAC